MIGKYRIADHIPRPSGKKRDRLNTSEHSKHKTVRGRHAGMMYVTHRRAIAVNFNLEASFSAYFMALDVGVIGTMTDYGGEM